MSPSTTSSSDTQAGTSTTLTILGCGTLGKAILRGITTARDEKPSEPKAILPSLTHFVACVSRPESAKAIASAFSSLDNLTIYHGDNQAGVGAADVVLLACKPQMFRSILGERGIRDALNGKLLISILAGVTVDQIHECLYGGGDDEYRNEDGKDSVLLTNRGRHPSAAAASSSAHCRIVRVMPNTASEIGQSMTVIASSQPALPAAQLNLVRWMFSRIGQVVVLPPHLMDASTALCGSGPAFFALMAEAMADGAVAMGIPRKEAQLMAAQTMKGTAELVLAGEHPALLRDKVSTPGGCTIGGLLIMEEGTVRGTIARAVREATVVAAKLGSGILGVNGTWR